MDLKKNNIVAIAAIAVVLVATVGVFGFFFVKKAEAPTGQTSATQPTVNQTTATQDPTTNKPPVQPVAPTPPPASAFVCGTSQVSDVDSNTYGSVQIGTQCWMTSNMMTTRYPDGTSITRGPVGSGGLWTGADLGFYAYPPNTANTAEETLANIQTGKLGFVYQWSAAMHGSVTAGVQGICPSRWHVPTHDEYTTMERAICTSGTCATDFPFDTSTTGWRGTNEGSKLSTETSGGTNSSGFTGHLAGYRFTDGTFVNRGTYAFLWSSSQSGSTAWYRGLGSGISTVIRFSGTKAYGFSVRCVRDY